jgi:hypothetical protein
MYDAVLGYRTRRSAYMKRAEASDQSATRDLAALTAVVILAARGTGRGRHYVAGPVLREIGGRRRSARKPRVFGLTGSGYWCPPCRPRQTSSAIVGVV